ncbi:MAG: replicative DNA helicase [Flavobacteriales bacterium]|nr:replicative DNA helicase [Flavobacteriales bacterium]
MAGIIGKVPPQNTEVESAVLGSILIDHEAIYKVEHLLTAECFYNPKNRQIYEQAILPMFRDNEPIDILTTFSKIERLKNSKQRRGVDAHYIASLTNNIASSANIVHHTLIIKELAIKRGLIAYASDLLSNLYKGEEDTLELVEAAMGGLDMISSSIAPNAFSRFDKVIKKSIDRITEVSLKKGDITGVASGFKLLDQMTSGWQPSDLIILAARPGMGKTTFVLELAKKAAIDNNVPVAFFSLEMSETQLGTKVISSASGIESDKLRKGNLNETEWGRLYEAVGKLERAPLYIDDTAGISIFELKTKCRRLKHKNPDLGLVVIDYLQLIKGGDPAIKNQIREQQISYISRSLKGLAKELDVAVIALSQLSRVVESRPDKRPMLSDLRESGAIEQDADIVSFLYRPEYYGMETDEEGNSLKGLAKLIIAKHRNGELGDVKLRFDGARSSFTNYLDEVTTNWDEYNFE